MSAGLSLELPADALEAIAQRAAELVLAELQHERPSPATASPYMTVSEAAEYLRCKPRRVYELRSNGTLSALTEGTGDARNGRALVLRSEVEALVSDSTGVATLVAIAGGARVRRVGR